MVLLESQQAKIGGQAVNFNDLPGIDGQTHSLKDYEDKQVLIIVFMCNHCPYVQAILQRLITIQSEYKDKGVQVIGINPNDTAHYPDDSMEAMIEKAPEQGINFAYLRDDNQETAKAYNAVCTPDIFVYDQERKLIYHGRIDDNWQDESTVNKRELKEALDKYLESGEIVEIQKPSMGCSIKWL